MTNMTESVRILLKAYGYELSLEKIMIILAKKDDKLREEIKQTIPELLSAKLIIQTGEDTYKTACEQKPNYFFVFQNNSYQEEQKASCLFCSHSPDNHTVAHWESIDEVRKGDIIFHECGNSIVAISEVQTEARDAIRPYPYKGRDPDSGRKIETMYVNLKTQVDPLNLKDALYPAQPEKVAPFNKNGKGNEGYLFYFNEACTKIIIEGIIKNFR